MTAVKHTLPLGLGNICLTLLKEVSYVQQGCIYLINCDILLQFKSTVFYFNILKM